MPVARQLSSKQRSQPKCGSFVGHGTLKINKTNHAYTGVIARVETDKQYMKRHQYTQKSSNHFLPNTLKCSSHRLPTFRRHLKHFYFSHYWHIERVRGCYS